MGRTFSTNVKGKVNEIKLDSKYGYQALFEVISNSIHSIKRSGIADGKITIDIERDFEYQIDISLSEEEQKRRASVKDITVTDNGEGFTYDNFDSFLTCYSEFKQKQFGGKGVGRFTCLKVFKYVSVSSVFGEDERFIRKFDFYPLNELQNEKAVVATNKEKNTVVKLHEIKLGYADAFPTDLAKLAELIIEHFFINFITKEIPIIIINDQLNGSLVVNDYYKNSGKREVVNQEFKIFDKTFTIYHVKADINKSNNVYLCANLRATETKIDLRKSIRNLQSNILVNGKKKWYYAYVTAEYLDEIVNSERTLLLFPQDDKYGGGVTDISFETFKQQIVAVISSFLKKDLELVEKEKILQIDNYINNTAPKYRMLRAHKPDLYEKIPNGLNKIKLELALYQEQQNWEMEITQQGQDIFDKSKKYDATKIEELKSKYCTGITALGKSCLADYVAKRKAILRIFENALAQDQETRKYNLEEAVHKLICPMKTTSDDINYEDMNLWIIDEQLAYHYYLASDMPQSKQTVTDVASEDRPDIAIYNNAYAFTDSDRPFNSITLIEFKKPMRDDYTEDVNPISQLNKYIREIRAGIAKDRTGRPISGSNLSTIPIYCYIIADITKKLKNRCIDAGMLETPDGEGYYNYNSNSSIKAYFEVISYNKLISTANKRNKILFEKLFSPKL